MPADGARLTARWVHIDKAALVADAARHGVSALVADFLAASKLELPERLRQALQADARHLIARGMRMRRLTLTVLDALRARGITPVLLKGASLAERLYPEQPLARPASDVDVWVTPPELDEAGRALAALGFSKQLDEGLADVTQEHHHVAWAGREGLVEVHFRLFSGFGGHTFDDAALASRLVKGSFHGRPVHWLAPADEFVYLATHAANHAFLRASWLVDLQRYLSVSARFEWPQLALDCRAAGFNNAVSAALWVVENALGVSLPEGARQAFPTGPLRRFGHGRVFSPEHLEAADLADHRWASSVLRIWLVDSPRAGVRHAADGMRRWFRRLRAAR